MIQPWFEAYLDIRREDPDDIEGANEIAYAILDLLDGDSFRFNLVMAVAKRELEN